MSKKPLKGMKGAKATSPAPAASDTPERPVLDIPSGTGDLRALLDTLKDSNRPAEMRRNALQAMQAASFSSLDFNAIRTEYIAVLRQIARDVDHELRQRALGILAREHDGFAQQALLEGLQDPTKALVPPEKALQLLSYDPHAGAYPIARQMVESDADEPVKLEALRLLAGDPQSGSLIEKVLANKNESTPLRRMAASALQALNPDRLHALANKVILDKDEDHDVIATVLTALNHFGDAHAIANNKPLLRRVEQLQASSRAKLKAVAKEFVKKHSL